MKIQNTNRNEEYSTLRTEDENNNLSIEKNKSSDSKIKRFLILILLLLLLFIFSKLFIKIFYTKNLEESKEIFITKINTKKLKIGIFFHRINGGGIERITALLANELAKLNIYEIYLFTGEKKEEDFELEKNIKRIDAYNGELLKRDTVGKYIEDNDIDLFIYSGYYSKDIKFLNRFNKKLILYCHGEFYFLYKSLKQDFLNYLSMTGKSSLFLTLVPDDLYIYRKKKINNSIIINNLLSFDPDKIIPSTLNSKTILLIGRGESKNKNFDKGIQAMKKIIDKVPDAKLLILSEKNKKTKYLEDLIVKLNLENHVEFVGFTKHPEIYFKDASIHLSLSDYEGFPMVIGETKAYGIPNIIAGKKYLSLSKKGTINTSEDNIDEIANECIKLLTNENYKKLKAKDAKESLDIFKNEVTIKKWIEIINSVYNNNVEFLLNKKNMIFPILK